MTRLSPTAENLSRDMLETGIEAAMMAVEAQLVITYRSFRLCGFYPMSSSELNKMMIEKPAAFTASAMAAGFTAMTGQRPDRVIAAALHPIRTETNRNMRHFGGQTHESD